MHKNQLFTEPRLRLTLLFSGVIGSILLVLGYAAHLALEKSANRSIDRELFILARGLNDRLTAVLKTPNQLPENAQQIIPELCLPQQACRSDQHDSMLLELVNEGYHLQLLNQKGETLAAIGEAPDRFPPNLTLQPFRTVRAADGEPYHLHLVPLHTQDSRSWGYLQVGLSVQQFDDYMNTLHLVILFGVPLAILLIGGASWGLAGRVIRPIYQSYAQMQQFTADAAHELRTPIASIRATLESTIGDSNSSSEEHHHLLHSLQRQAQRLSRLTQDLLFLAQLDAQPKPPTKETICLNELVQDLEEELAPLALAAKVDFQCQTQANQPIEINGHPGQIYRLVTNLITNAINYTPADGFVTVKLTHTQNSAIIRVHDSGIGIAASELPYLYDRFYRVNRDRGRQTGGSGLGLAIAQAIARQHGGKITASSTIGKGSAFSIHFPRSQ